MKTILGMFVLGLIVTAVLVAEVVQSFIAASPYLLVFALVFGVLRARMRRTATSGVPRGPMRPTAPVRPVGTPVAGWVLVPMWMSPQHPALPVIDAEVIDERREPT